MEKHLVLKAFESIISYIDEGIHIIDRSGTTVFYNAAMSKIEGLEIDEVMNRHILEVFPNWTTENSTLLTALEKGERIDHQKQSYLNFKGKKISTVNSTLPIYDRTEIIGAVEISRNFTEVNNLSDQIIELQQKLINPKKTKTGKKHYTFDNLIGQNKKYLEAIKIAKRAAASDSSVLIYGETGTGKELFAQSIHYESNRKDNPFIAINCAAMPETLLESILFGTAKGGFTGASDKPGLFEQANEGTLFLDEINSMSLSLQAKLLRVLQEGYVRRVGGLKDVLVDVRIIAATNERPIGLINSGDFRKDLYYRINVLSIFIPSLKDRKEDIKLLVDFFVDSFNSKLGKDVWMLSSDLHEMFMEHNWNGNIRELQNVIESAMNMVTDEHVIGKEHLQEHVLDQFSNQSKEDEIQSIKFDKEVGLNGYIENIEKEIIEATMHRCNSNVTKAADELKISRQNLQYKLKKLF